MRTSSASTANRILLLILMSLSTVIFAQSKPNAAEKHTALRQKAQKAYAAKDYREARQAFLDLYAFAPGRPSTVYNLACVNALLGERKEALRWLDLFARMGQTADAANDPDLASVVDSAEFKNMVERMGSKRPGVTSSKVRASFPAAKLVEDITYDVRTGEFFVTSLIDKKILRIGKDHKVTVAADLSSDPGWPVFALALQGGKNRVLWVAAAAMPDFAASPKGDWGKSVLLKVDAENGKILARFAPPENGHVLGDLALASNGDVAVADGRAAAVYLLKSGDKALKRIDGEEFVSPQTPAFSADGKYVFVADYVRGVARIECASGSILWLKAPEEFALSGIDGMYLRGNQLIAVQNGTNPTRIVRLSLNREMSKIEGLEVLASGDAATDINHGVWQGTSFYYIANAGWDALDDHGNRKPDAKASIPEIRVLRGVSRNELRSQP